MKKKIVIMSMLCLALTASASGQSNEVDSSYMDGCHAAIPAAHLSQKRQRRLRMGQKLVSGGQGWNICFPWFASGLW